MSDGIKQDLKDDFYRFVGKCWNDGYSSDVREAILLNPCSSGFYELCVEYVDFALNAEIIGGNVVYSDISKLSICQSTLVFINEHGISDIDTLLDVIFRFYSLAKTRCDHRDFTSMSYDPGNFEKMFMPQKIDDPEIQFGVLYRKIRICGWKEDIRPMILNYIREQS